MPGSILPPPVGTFRQKHDSGSPDAVVRVELLGLLRRWLFAFRPARNVQDLGSNLLPQFPLIADDATNVPRVFLRCRVLVSMGNIIP